MSDFRSVVGKTAVVTGASRGIGEGIAETLAAEGVSIVLADIRPEVEGTAERIATENPDVTVLGRVVDVAEEAAVADLVRYPVSELGRLDIMANNAGIHVTPANVWETDNADVDRLLAVNFKGVFHAANSPRSRCSNSGRFHRQHRPPSSARSATPVRPRTGRRRTACTPSRCPCRVGPLRTASR